MVLRYKDKHVFTDRNENLTVCTEQVMSPLTEHAACGLPNPTPFICNHRGVPLV